MPQATMRSLVFISGIASASRFHPADDGENKEIP